MTIMVRNSRSFRATLNQGTSAIKDNLADFLTMSRAVIGLIILSLSFIGKDAYSEGLAQNADNIGVRYIFGLEGGTVVRHNIAGICSDKNNFNNSVRFWLPQALY